MPLSYLLVVGCAETQKNQFVIQDNQGQPYTIPIEPTLGKGLESYRLVFYSAPQIDLGKVPIYEIEIGVVNPREVVARSKSGSRALASIVEMAKQREGILLAEREKLKILQAESNGISSGEPRKMKLQRKFETEQRKFEQKRNKFQQELEGEQRRLVRLYISKIRSAVEQVAMKEGLDLVLDKFEDFKSAKDLLSPVVMDLLKQDHRDITSETVQMMNKIYQ